MIKLNDDQKATLSAIKHNLEKISTDTSFRIPKNEVTAAVEVEIKVEVNPTPEYSKYMQALDILDRLKLGSEDYQTWEEIVKMRKRMLLQS